MQQKYVLDDYRWVLHDFKMVSGKILVRSLNETIVSHNSLVFSHLLVHKMVCTWFAVVGGWMADWWLLALNTSPPAAASPRSAIEQLVISEPLPSRGHRRMVSCDQPWVVNNQGEKQWSPTMLVEHLGGWASRWLLRWKAMVDHF